MSASQLAQIHFCNKQNVNHMFKNPSKIQSYILINVTITVHVYKKTKVLPEPYGP